MCCSCTFFSLFSLHSILMFSWFSLYMDWLCLFTSHLHPFLLTYLSHLCLVCVRCGSAANVLIGLYAASDACWLAEFFTFFGLLLTLGHVLRPYLAACNFCVIRLLILSKKMFLHPLFLSLLYFFIFGIFLFRYVNPTSLVSYGNVTSCCPGLWFRLDLGGLNGMRRLNVLLIINTLRSAFHILLICMWSCRPYFVNCK